jgi:hypothetical protein
MRHALATLVSASTALAGCSLLYNPNDLPQQADAMPDMEMVVDANLTGHRDELGVVHQVIQLVDEYEDVHSNPSVR